MARLTGVVASACVPLLRSSIDQFINQNGFDLLLTYTNRLSDAMFHGPVFTACLKCIRAFSNTDVSTASSAIFATPRPRGPHSP